MQPQMLTVRNVVFAILGTAVLVLKGYYTGPGEQLVKAYAGNFFVSFALYFAILSATRGSRYPRLFASVAVFAAVTSFEVTDGFGIMGNVYDPVDILANALGIGFAVLVDVVSGNLWRSRERRGSGGHLARPSD